MLNKFGVLGVLAVTILTACGDATSTGVFGTTAQLKVVHAASTVGAIEVRMGGTPLISGLSFGQSSAAIPVPAGQRRLTFRSDGTTIAAVDVNLSADGLNAVTLSEDTAQVTPVTPDTGHAATNRANIRIINVASENTSPPTSIGILINFPGVATDSVARMALDSRVASHGPLMYFDPGNFRIRFIDGDPSDISAPVNVLAQVEFAVAAGEKKAVVLERSANGTYSAKVVTEP